MIGSKLIYSQEERYCPLSLYWIFLKPVLEKQHRHSNGLCQRPFYGPWQTCWGLGGMKYPGLALPVLIRITKKARRLKNCIFQRLLVVALL